MPNYSDGKIYKLVNDETDYVYIGSTTQPLNKRMRGHRDECRERPNTFKAKTMSEYDIKSWRIVLIKNVACNNKEELNMEEEAVRKEFISNGHKLMNVTRCHRTLQDYKDSRKVYDKKYQQSLKERKPPCDLLEKEITGDELTEQYIRRVVNQLKKRLEWELREIRKAVK